MLKWTDTNYPFTSFKVLIYEKLFILILNFDLNFIYIYIIS